MPFYALPSAPIGKYVIYVDRASNKLWVSDSNHHVLLSSIVGTGRGGLKNKINMDDLVTPTGTFTVDIILFKDERFNRVAKDNLTRYRNTKFYSLLKSTGSLAQLFLNMNSLDFNDDGKADRAYGDGYIGITSDDNKSVTGPKMQFLGQIPYWCSIGLHGTSDPKSIGKTNSGGCVHLPANIISDLILNHLVSIGSTVVISDKDGGH